MLLQQEETRLRKPRRQRRETEVEQVLATDAARLLQDGAEPPGAHRPTVRRKIAAFIQRYRHEWILERHGYRTPAQVLEQG